MKLDLGKMINKIFLIRRKSAKNWWHFWGCKKVFNNTYRVCWKNSQNTPFRICLFVCCFWNLWLGPVSKNLQLERTAGKNALSRINKIFAKFESDFSKTKEGIAPKSREILQTFVLWGMGKFPALHHTKVCKISRLCKTIVFALILWTCHL